MGLQQLNNQDDKHFLWIKDLVNLRGRAFLWASSLV